jgi:hypothetical protein
MQGGRSQRPGFHRPVGPSKVKVRRRLASAQSEPLGLQSRLCHLAPSQPPLGDALERGPLKVLDASLGVGRSGSNRWRTRRGTRTTPRYSPILAPNSTACRSAFQRPSSGRLNNIGAHDRARASFRKFSNRPSAKTVANGAGYLSSLFMADGRAGSRAWEGTDALRDGLPRYSPYWRSPGAPPWQSGRNRRRTRLISKSTRATPPVCTNRIAG